MSRRYVALIGDAIRSRDLTPARRRRLQSQLDRVLDDLNRRWRRTVVAGFTIVLGDQFEGLLADTSAVWELSHQIRAELTDMDWVIAAGRGAVTTSLAKRAAAVDGPCFHRAREALHAAKAERRVCTFAGFGRHDAVLNGLARYYSALYWGWTARQREAANLLRVLDRTDVAARLGVDRSAVSHLARRLGWRLVTRGDRVFRQLLEAA